LGAQDDPDVVSCADSTSTGGASVGSPLPTRPRWLLWGSGWCCRGGARWYTVDASCRPRDSLARRSPPPIFPIKSLLPCGHGLATLQRPGYPVARAGYPATGYPATAWLPCNGLVTLWHGLATLRQATLQRPGYPVAQAGYPVAGQMRGGGSPRHTAGSPPPASALWRPRARGAGVAKSSQSPRGLPPPRPATAGLPCRGICPLPPPPQASHPPPRGEGRPWPLNPQRSSRGWSLGAGHPPEPSPPTPTVPPGQAPTQRAQAPLA
jgi:hypothetical protein